MKKRSSHLVGSENTQSFLGVMRQLIPYAAPYRYLIILSLALTLGGAALAQVTPLTLQYVVNSVTDLVQAHATLGSGWHVLALAASILVVKELATLGVTIGERYLGEKLKVMIGADLSNAAFTHLLSLDMAYFDGDDNTVGRITKRIDLGVEALARTVKNVFADILPLFANAAVALIVMYSVNVWVGITSTAIVPVYVALSLNQARQQKGVRNSIRETQEARTSTMLNVLSAVKLVKSYTRERYEVENHRAINSRLTAVEARHHWVNHVYDGTKLFFGQIGAALVVIVTAVLILQGQMTVGAIMLHLLLYNNVTAPIRELHRIYDETNEAIAFSAGFFAIFHAKPTLLSVGEPVTDSDVRGSIELSHVSFSYVPDREVTHDVSLRIPAKKTVALIGVSGAGKSTIANLIGRFYDPQDGEVLLDGVDVRRYPLETVRRNIGFVLQENHIFPGSILENVRYGDLEASDEAVVAATRRAGLHEEVARLPQGYLSPANRLSGGQKQRIAIARVFLKDPPILVLDEPTASLDALAAQQIKAALDSVRSDRTVLIISHNIAAMVDADHIYVLEQGRVIGEGTHDTLYKENARYKEIIDTNVKTMNLDKLGEALKGQHLT